MKELLKSFKDCLFEALNCNPLEDPTADYKDWAVYEGFKRKFGNSYQWQVINRARQMHECVRGHLIREGESYYIYSYEVGAGHGMKICNGCMALLLFFHGAHNLEPNMGTHWDLEKKEPQWIKGSSE